MRVFIAGATGVIGRPLTAQLLSTNHEVVAMTRSDKRAADLKQRGMTPVVCDVLDREKLHRCVVDAQPEVVIDQLTALPKRIDPRKIKQQLSVTNRLRSEGTRNLFDAALAAGAKQFIAQSIAFAYAPDGDGLKTEDDALYDTSPASFRDVIGAIRHLEETTLSSEALPGVVLRYGFFYGPGTAYAAAGSVAEDVQGKRFPIIGKGTGVFSFIHVEDAATATVAALQHAHAGVYNIVDDEPARIADWLPFYADLLGAPRPSHVPRWLARLLVGRYATYLMCNQRGVSNAKAKRVFGWSLKFPTWQSGFRETLSRS